MLFRSAVIAVALDRQSRRGVSLQKIYNLGDLLPGLLGQEGTAGAEIKSLLLKTLPVLGPGWANNDLPFSRGGGGRKEGDEENKRSYARTPRSLARLKSC